MYQPILSFSHLKQSRNLLIVMVKIKIIGYIFLPFKHSDFYTTGILFFNICYILRFHIFVNHIQKKRFRSASLFCPIMLKHAKHRLKQNL